MSNLKLYVCLFLLSYTHSIIAQEEDNFRDLQIENLIEQFIENNELEEFDITDLIERFSVLKTKPLNLNTADELALSAIFFLTPTEINAILNHRDNYGDFLALEELQTVDQLDYNKIKLIAPFLSISAGDSQKFDLKGLAESGKSTLFLRYKRILQEKKGYQEDENGEANYAGSPDHYYLRYRFDSGRSLKGGVTLEKDPGEQFFRGINKNIGFDFYSAYAYAEYIKPWLQAINIGDYSISMGQGLILHNGFGAGKSIYTVDIKKDGQTVRPYSSVNESNFFRGIGTTIKPIKNTSLSLFYSSKNVDGTINADTTEIDDFGSFNSIARDGLHRTESEIAKKGQVNQTNYGGSFHYSTRSLKIGINHLSYNFSKPVNQSDQLYRLYSFSGTNLSATSLDYSWRYKNINTFGEIARSQNGGIAQTYSAIMTLDKKVDIALSYRNFAKDYQTLEANAFSEGTLPINEQGIYFGLETRINYQWKISSYIDYWKNPWLRFRVDAPGSGREFLVRIDHSKKRTYNVYLQYRYETKNLNSSVAENKVDPIIFTHNHRMRLHFSYKINKELEIRSRVEGSAFSKDGIQSYGFLVYQDLFYKPLEYPISVNGRIALFDTDGFDTRIYTYENDLLYEFYIPFFQRQGLRSYINFKYRVRRNINWEFKLARTLLSNEESIGSGNELVNGNKRTEFKTQLKITF